MKTFNKYAPLVISLLAIAGGSAAFGLGTASQPIDASFTKQAAMGGMAEIKMGHLAEQKGTNPTVKAFGKRMVTDHTKADDQLKQVAAKDKLMLPSGIDKDQQAMYSNLAGLSGAEFDKAYAQDMVTDHEQTMQVFQQELSSGANPDLKKFASDTLPTIQDHLKMAKQMQTTVTGNGGGM